MASLFIYGLLMIVNRNNSGTVISSGLVRETNFSLKITGKTFKLISDTLYENKIGSIVRELSCNALDSHRSAGKSDVPFVIHLPSVYEPTFYVKDYGIGMSQETIETIYSTYFASTKDTQNLDVGGMGVGGKTPFSYSTSFSIISCFNGMKYNYSAMIGEDDMPTLSLFGSDPTDEPNGVTIEMNVNADDYDRFATEVLSQLRFFKVKPILLNNIYNVEFADIEYKDTFGDFKTTDSVSGLWIVQGEVGYRLDKDQFADKIKDKDKLEFFNLFKNGVMNFDIGDIEVTISREGVSYSQHTVDNLEKFVNIHAPIIYGNIKSHIANMKSDWERVCYLNDDNMHRRFAALASLKLGKDGNIGDKKLQIHGNGTAQYTITMTNDWHVTAFINKFSISTFDARTLRRSYVKSHELVVTPNSNTRVFIRDVAKATIGKLKHFVSGHDGEVYLIEHPGGAAHVDEQFYKDIQRIFAGADLIRVSTLPENVTKSGRTRQYYGGNGMGPVVVYRFRTQGDNPHSTFRTDSFYNWERVYDEEEIDTGYFLTYTHYPRMNATGDDLDLIAMMVRNQQFDKDIYVIKDTKAELLQSNPNFSCPIIYSKKLLREANKQLEKSKHERERYKFAQSVVRHVKDLVGSPEADLHLTHADISRLPTDALPCRINRLHSIGKNYLTRIEKKLEACPDKLINTLYKQKCTKVTIPVEKIDEVFDRKANLENFYGKYPLVYEIAKAPKAYGDNVIKRSKNMVDYMLLVDKVASLPVE